MIKTIEIDAIEAGARLRPIDPAHVVFIAASIEKGGLKQPVTVRPTADGYRLTMGAHRLQALKELGWTTLTIGEHVIVQPRDEKAAMIDEIDENLARHELNALDRALFLARRREIYDEQGAEAHGGDRKSKKFRDEIKSQSLRLGFAERFSQDVADRVGLSERTVQTALKIAKSLDPAAAKAIRGTLIERNQNELLRLIEMTPDQQVALAAKLTSGQIKTVAEGRVALNLDAPIHNDPQGKLWSALLANWAKASKETRAAFLRAILPEGPQS